MRITPLGNNLGAEIGGVDLTTITDADFDRIYQAWLDHLVLRVRGQNLTDEAFQAFSARFGPLEEAPFGKITEEEKRRIKNRYVTMISNIRMDGRPIGGLGNKEAAWHSDMTYKEVIPPASILYAIEIPRTGGETLFANQYAALECMPAELKARIRDISIKHDASHNSIGELRRGFHELPDPRQVEGAVHPIIRFHPETGREALFLGRRDYAYMAGLSLEDSEALLDETWQYAARPENTWTQTWQVGDVVIWDNRCILHRRTGFDDNERRLMKRCQVLAREAVSSQE